jgi:predicted membrane-bound spermidine synthase
MNYQISKELIYFISKITGLCSIIYILFFAQILYTLYNTPTAFTLTIAIFLLGGLTGNYKKEKFVKIKNIFLITEFSLPIISLIGTGLIFLTYLSNLPTFVNLLISTAVIFKIGFLSGLETHLIQKQNKSIDKSKIIFFQLIGIISGALIFSTLLIPIFGLLSVLVIVGFLNLCIASTFVIYRDITHKHFEFDFGEIFTITLLIGFLILSFYINDYATLLDEKIIGGILE